MGKAQCYKISCYSLSRVISINILSIKDERLLLDKFVEAFKGEDAQVCIVSFVKVLINKLVIGDVELLDDIDHLKTSSPVEGEDCLIEIYKGITKLYPNYNLEVILGIINNAGDSPKFIPHRDSTKDELLNFWRSIGVLDKLSFFPEEIIENPELIGKPKRIPKKVKAKKTKSSLKVTSLKGLEKLKKTIKNKVIGQDDIVDQVVNQIKGISAGLYSRTNLFFIGPTGTGKTYLSKTLANELFGEKQFYKINCAEYSKGHEVSKLIGSPPGYVGFGDTPILKRLAKESNQWVFLFDEIEKGHTSLYDFALSLLDEGTATDNLGSTLDFTRSIFLFTSNNGMMDLNLGSRKVGFGGEVIEYENSRESIKERLKTNFSPEFLGRMDSVILFNQLNRSDIKKITKLELDFLPVNKTKALIDYIVDYGFSAEYGARNIAKYIKSDIAPVVADALLSFKNPGKDGNYTIRVGSSSLSIQDIKKGKTDELTR